MDSFASESARLRWSIFLDVAERSGIDAIVLEKDFWVCWCLRILFDSTEVGDQVIFKGGTSLSKVYDLIKRFSEDLDLTISKDALGISSQELPHKASSRTQRQKLIKSLRKRGGEFVAGTVKEQLESAIGKVLTENWSLDIDELDSQTLLFRYPRASELKDELPYLAKYVRLEFGVLGDTWPTEKRQITSYIGEALPDLFKTSLFEATIMDVRRTFWEKITLLHAEHHRPSDKPTPQRISRHYYDLFKLIDAGLAEKEAKSSELLESVVEHKKVYFASGWASYETAIRGTVKLLPVSVRMQDLEADYEAMQQMFFEEPPTFSVVIEKIAELEQLINS